jgi:ribonuclease VapC
VIAVDTSALMAIALDEPEADACIAALTHDDDLLISAGTVAETLIVAAQRGIGEELSQLIDEAGFEIVAVTGAAARRIAAAHRQWGRGNHPAALNLGDCFAYEVAREHSCPLLYVGDDFSRTDVRRVL